MKTVISPSRLKTLRERLELTPTKLAKKLAKLKTPVTTKTISNIEKHDGETYRVRENTLKSLSRALGVSPDVLSGEQPLPEKRSPGDSISVQLDSQISLNYELIARRYGVSFEEVVNIAPLLFLKTAEESLTRQKRVLEEEAMEEISRFCRASGDMMPSSIDTAPKGLLEHFDSGEKFYGDRYYAIEKNDLFEETVPYDDHYMEDLPNPFADYLNEICTSELGPKMASLSVEEHMGFYGYLPGGRVPQYIICKDDIEKITLGSNKALLALTSGAASIKDIPEKLWEPRRAGDRVAWLEDKYILAQQDDDGDDPDLGSPGTTLDNEA